MRRRYKRKRRQYLSPRQVKQRRKKRILWTVGIVVAAFVLLWIIPFTRAKMLTLPPIKGIQQLWTNIVDPQKDVLSQSEATPIVDNASTQTDIPSTSSNASESDVALTTEQNGFVSLEPNYVFEIKPTIESDSILLNITEQLEIKNTSNNPISDVLLFIPTNETFALTQITVNGTDALTQTTREGEDQLRISLPEAINTDGSTRIAMAFSIRVSEGFVLPNYNNGRIALVADFYPTLAVRYSDEWVADKTLLVQNVGNFTSTIYAEESDELVYLATGVRQEIATTVTPEITATTTSAPESTTTDSVSPTMTYSAINIPSFAFARASRMRTGAIEEGTTSLDFYFFNTSRVDTWKEAGQPLLTYLVALFGEYSTPIPVIQGTLESSCQENGGMIFVDEDWTTTATDANKKVFLIETAKIYLGPTASHDFWLYDLLSRYAGQSYGVNYQETIAQQETAPLSENSGTVDTTEASISTPTQSYIPEGIDEDVYSLMGLRDLIGAEAFDAAVKKYVADAGTTAFANCFATDKQSDVARWIEYERK